MLVCCHEELWQRDAGSASRESQAAGRLSALTLKHGRACASHPAAISTPGAIASRTAVAGSAWSAAARPPPRPAGDAVGDGGPGWHIAAVPFRGRARAQGTVERDDRGPCRSAGDYADRADQAGGWRLAPPTGRRHLSFVGPGHARSGGLRLARAAVRPPGQAAGEPTAPTPARRWPSMWSTI